MDIEKTRKEKILNAFWQYIECPWEQHFASIQYEPDGGMRIIFALKIQSNPETSCGHNHYRPEWSTKVWCQSVVEAGAHESDCEDRNIRNKDTERLKGDFLLDHLIDALFLSLEVFKQGSKYAETRA